MATGTVKRLNARRGFGFVQPDDGGKDVFVHVTAVQAAGRDGLHGGQKVAYGVVTGRGEAASLPSAVWFPNGGRAASPEVAPGHTGGTTWN